MIPYSITAAGVIYNKDLFEQQGLEVPTTWSELIEVCEAFQSAGITPIYGTYQGHVDGLAGPVRLRHRQHDRHRRLLRPS